jgi:hypothetical protein
MPPRNGANTTATTPEMQRYFSAFRPRKAYVTLHPQMGHVAVVRVTRGTPISREHQGHFMSGYRSVSPMSSNVKVTVPESTDVLELTALMSRLHGSCKSRHHDCAKERNDDDHGQNDPHFHAVGCT